MAKLTLLHEEKQPQAAEPSCLSWWQNKRQLIKGAIILGAGLLSALVLLRGEGDTTTSEKPRLDSRGLMSLSDADFQPDSFTASGLIHSNSDHGLSKRANNPPIVLNPIPDQSVEFNTPYLYCLDIVADFEDSDGDKVSLTAALADSSPLPGWLQFQLRLMGTYDTPGYANRVASNGNFAFVADGLGGGLQVIDISDPSRAAWVSDYGNNVVDVAFQGNIACLATGYGLEIVNLSTMNDPRWLASIALPGEAVSIVTRNNLAVLMTNMPASLQAVDISTPAEPNVSGSYFFSSSFGADVAIRDNLCFAVTGDGLQIIDVSNPAVLNLVGTYANLTGANGIAISGDVALIAEVDNGLKLIDIANPANPVFVSTYDMPGWEDWTMEIAVNGNYALLASGPAGLQVIDIARPANVTLVGQYNTPDMAWGVAAVGNLALVADQQSGLQIINWEQYCLSGIPLESNLDSLSIQITASDRRGGVVTETFQLRGNHRPYVRQPILDKSTEIDVLFALKIQPNITFCDPDGDTMLLSSKQSDGEILPDWLQFSFVNLVGHYESNAATVSVTDDGKTVLMAHWNTGLQLIDISNPATPNWIGGYNSLPGCNPKDIAISHELALLACGDLGLQVMNITDRSMPTWIGGYDSVGWARGVAVQGNVTCLAAAGLAIFDISEPTWPTLLIRYQPLSWSFTKDVVISGNLALVTASPVGLQLIDISNPQAPLWKGEYITDDPDGLLVRDQVVFMADMVYGIYIIDIAIPTNPQFIGGYAGLWGHLAASGSRLFVGADDFHVIDISNLAQPILLHTHKKTGGGPMLTDVDNYGNLALLADWDHGLWLLKTDNWQLSGIPQSSDAGNYFIDITATDNWGASGTDTFQLRVEGAPILMEPIPTQLVEVGSRYNFIVDYYFLDPNNDPITYTATLINSQPLPDWISFRRVGGIFSGKPQSSDTGIWEIELSVSDGINPVTFTQLTLVVDNFPAVKKPIEDQTTSVGSYFELIISEDIFVDIDEGDKLQYSASLSYGEPLPDWLTFDVSQSIFYGIPQVGDEGSFSIRVVATDSYGGDASDDFMLRVESRESAMIRNFMTVIGYVGSITSVYALHRNRALLLNRIWKGRYQKPKEEVAVRQPYQRKLSVSPKDVRIVKAQVRREDMQCTFGGRFFGGRWPLRDYPDALLPRWLAFNRITNTLEGTPELKDLEKLFIQVLGAGNVILEQFILEVKSDQKPEEMVSKAFGNMAGVLTSAGSSTMFGKVVDEEALEMVELQGEQSEGVLSLV